jgi:hypothetical protein
MIRIVPAAIALVAVVVYDVKPAETAGVCRGGALARRCPLPRG